MYTIKFTDNWDAHDDFAYTIGTGYETIKEAEEAVADFKHEDAKNGEENRWTYSIVKDGQLMEEKILEVIAKHPNGIRLREIGKEVHEWHPNLVPYIWELEREGKIVSITHSDPANMDNYILYKIA